MSELGALTHVVMPAAKVTVVVNVTGIAVEGVDGGGFGGDVATLTGLRDRPLRVSSTCFRGVQLDLDLVTAVKLFGPGLRNLTDSVVSLEDVAGPFSRELTERLHDSMGDAEARRSLVRTIRRHLDGASGPAPQVAAAWQALRDSGGTITVSGLADHVGWSRRHLSSRMALELGMPPKPLARLVRFERAAEMLGQVRPRRDGGEIAASAGFADQPHLCREVRRFAATVPAALREQEQAFAPAGDEVTDVQGSPKARS